MFTFFVVVISVLAFFLILIILLQSGKGGGLAAEFGGASSSTDSIIGGRQAATLLTKLTWIGGGAFLFLSLVLSVLSSRTQGTPESILRTEFGESGDRPASVLESETTGEPLRIQDEAAPSGTDQGGGPTEGQPGDEGGGR